MRDTPDLLQCLRVEHAQKVVLSPMNQDIQKTAHLINEVLSRSGSR